MRLTYTYVKTVKSAKYNHKVHLKLQCVINMNMTW